MPELPEVETIRRGLQQRIVNLTLQEVEVLNAKTFFGDSKTLSGKKVLNTRRFAKVLVIDLTGNLSVLFHLKMTGQLIWIKSKTKSSNNKLGVNNDKLIGGHPTMDMRGEMPNSSTRVIFNFSDGSQLFFNDQRKFGWVKVVPTAEVESIKFIQDLGPEPLENKFTSQVLKNQLIKRKNLPVKVALMDQQLISGIGNIYASEACFNCGVDPRRKVSSLNDKEFDELHKGIVKSLEDGIKHGGSSRAHFVNADGEPGLFLDYAFVYQRDGESCKKCKTTITKLVLGGRGTFFCPNCQS